MEIRSWHFFEWIYFFRSVYDIERVVYTLLEYDTVFWNYLKSSEIFWWRSTKRSLQFAFARLGKLSPTSYAYCHYQGHPLKCGFYSIFWILNKAFNGCPRYACVCMCWLCITPVAFSTERRQFKLHSAKLMLSKNARIYVQVQLEFLYHVG